MFATSHSPRTPQFPAKRSKLPSSLSPCVPRTHKTKAGSGSRSPQPPPSHSSRNTVFSQASLLHRSRVRLYHLKTEYNSVMEIVKERQRKHILARILKDRYGVSLARTKVEVASMQELVKEALGKWQVRVAQQAAARMVQWLYRMRVERVKKMMHVKEYMSAWRIQRQWKRYLRDTVIPRRAVSLRAFAAATIQRVYRGYRARVSTEKLRLTSEINKLSMHYRLIRNQLKHDSALTIYRAWRRWKVSDNSDQETGGSLTADAPCGADDCFPAGIPEGPKRESGRFV